MMKETIEKFKQENGNDKFTNKEFLMYLVTKVDELVPIVASNKTSIIWLKRIVFILLAIALGGGGYTLFS